MFVFLTFSKFYLSHKAVGGGVRGGAPIRALKPTLSLGVFSLKVRRKTKEKTEPKAVNLQQLHRHISQKSPSLEESTCAGFGAQSAVRLSRGQSSKRARPQRKWIRENMPTVSMNIVIFYVPMPTGTL